MVRRKQNKRGLLLKALNGLLLLFTLAAALALFLAYFAPQVDPNRTIWFAYLGLAAPFLYLANLFLLLFWTMRWRPVAFLPLLVLLMGLGHVGKYLKISVKQHYEASARSTDPLRVMSYNVGGFWGGGNETKKNRMGEIMAYMQKENPDILCLQEFEMSRVNPRQRFDSVMKAWPYHAIHNVIDLPEGGGWGLALYSRHRILRSGKVAFERSNNSAMWADLLIGRDTVRVFNVHLQTTGVDEADREFFRPETGIPDSLNLDKPMGIARKLARNYRSRAVQADTLAGLVHDGTPLVIACGDFNDTPMSYAYRRVRGDFEDAFRQRGQGLASTYRGMRGLFRIDYLFYSDGFKALDYRSDPLPWSDHNPVVVDLARHKP